MKQSTGRILTTHGGRLPDPAVMQELMAAKQPGGDAEKADKMIRNGVVELLRRQQEIGIDVMSDGEFYKWGVANQAHYDSRYTGIKNRPTGPGDMTWRGQKSPEMLNPRFARLFAYLARVGDPDVGAPPLPGFFPGQKGTHYYLSEPLKYRSNEAMKQELRVVRQALDDAGVSPADVFYPLIGPHWFTTFVFNEFYKTDEEYAFALAEALRGEYEAVVEAGFVLQIDDPALADRFSMLNPPVSVKEYRSYLEPWVEATNHALRNIPEDKIRYHVCWGSFHYPHVTDIGFEHIVDLMLKVKAQAYSIEAASVTHELDYKVWENVKLPAGKILIPGVISHATSNRIEAPELVCERILQYAKIAGRENVIAGVDCGPGLRCHDDAAWAKLEALRTGAELASRKLWR